MRARVEREGLGDAVTRSSLLADVEALIGRRHPGLLDDWRTAHEALGRIERTLRGDLP